MRNEFLAQKIGHHHLMAQSYLTLIHYIDIEVYGEFVDSLMNTLGDLSGNDFWYDMDYENLKNARETVITEIGFECAFHAEEFMDLEIDSGDFDEATAGLWFDTVLLLCEFSRQKTKFLSCAVDVFVENRSFFIGDEFQRLLGELVDCQMMTTVDRFAKAMGFDCLKPSSSSVEEDMLQMSLRLSKSSAGAKGKGKELLN